MDIIFGGKQFRTGTKTAVMYQRLEHVGKLPFEDMGDEPLVRALCREFDINEIFTISMGRLHDAMASLYMRIIDRWRAEHPDRAREIELRETEEKRPHNYTQAVTRLRNTSWRGYTPEFGGFCIFEPIVRVSQLAEYPIGQFAEIKKLEAVEIPPPPPIPGSPSAPVTIERIKALREHVQARENWLTRAAREIDTMADVLDAIDVGSLKLVSQV